MAYQGDPRRIPFQSAAFPFFPPLRGGGGGVGAHPPEPHDINNFSALSNSAMLEVLARATGTHTAMPTGSSSRSPSIPASTCSSPTRMWFLLRKRNSRRVTSSSARVSRRRGWHCCWCTRATWRSHRATELRGQGNRWLLPSMRRARRGSRVGGSSVALSTPAEAAAGTSACVGRTRCSRRGGWRTCEA